MDKLQVAWRWIAESVAFCADLTGLVVGIGAIIAFVKHRDKISIAVRVLAASLMGERSKRIRETLGRLESLNYDNKEDKPEIIALLGQACGQIKPLLSHSADFLTIHQELLEVTDKKVKLTEATKRRIVHEMHGALDSASMFSTKEIMREKQ